MNYNQKINNIFDRQKTVKLQILFNKPDIFYFLSVRNNLSVLAYLKGDGSTNKKSTGGKNKKIKTNRDIQDIVD